jgi:uroporphyrin-III C-methyltransferase
MSVAVSSETVERGLPGRVWLVGAGPGDPELLTIKALRAIENADIVLHDRLVSRPILDLIPTGVLRLDVGKLGYGRSMSQQRINDLLVAFSSSGHRVVRLKGGDPFVFGRGGEEALALAAAGIPFEVVPGVTAGVAVPEVAGIPVTHRGIARSVAFVTAESTDASHGTDAGAEGVHDWTALARIDTVVVFMAGARAASTAASLLAAGRAADTPVAVLVDGTLPTMRSEMTDLGTLADSGVSTPPGRPCTLVIGDVVSLAPQIHAGFSAASGSRAPRTVRTVHAARAEAG